MIDEILYQKHSNAITTSQHTEISVEYAIQMLEEADAEMCAHLKGAKRNPDDTNKAAETTWRQTQWHHTIMHKIQGLKDLLK
jgi:hypothetical protein